MKSYLKTEEEYRQVMERIETYLTKATASGGFQSLSDLGKDELRRLSLLAEIYEDGVPFMPIRVKDTIRSK